MFIFSVKEQYVTNAVMEVKCVFCKDTFVLVFFKKLITAQLLFHQSSDLLG